MTDAELDVVGKELGQMYNWLNNFNNLTNDVSDEGRSMVKDFEPNVSPTNSSHEDLADKMKQLRDITSTFRVVGSGVGGSLSKGYHARVPKDDSVQPVDVVGAVDTL